MTERHHARIVFFGQHNIRKVGMFMLGVAGWLVISILFSHSVFAAGGVGGGGSGGGGSGGHQTSNGWGWADYPTSGPGPTDGFRNGASWSNIKATCQVAGASKIYIHIILDQYKEGKGYDYKSIQDSPYRFAGKFTDGSIVDHGRAVAITTEDARSAFQALPSKGVPTTVNGVTYVFGSNVSWFCANPTPQNQVQTIALIFCKNNGSGAVVANAQKPGEKFNYRLQRRVDGVWKDDYTETSYGRTNIASGDYQEFNISKYTSVGRYAFRVRIRAVSSNEQFITNEASVGKCATWDYRYKAFSTTPASTAISMGQPIQPSTLPQIARSTKIEVTTRVRNNGKATGDNFGQTIEFKWAGYPPDWSPIPLGAILHTPIAADPNDTGSNDRVVTREYTVPPDAISGRIGCFRARINQFTGLNNNGERTVTSGTKWRFVGNGTDPNGTMRCFRVAGGPVQPACTISSSSSLVNAGENLTLTWQSQNATSAKLTGAPGLPVTTVALNGNRVVAPNVRTEYTLLVESATGGESQCSVVVDVRTNKPFITVQGGDMYSGARFETGGECVATPAAEGARIKTNGAYGKEGLRQLYGASAGQYAVFGSGAIGDFAAKNTNTFLGNYGYYRNNLVSVLNTIDSSYDSDVRDGLFSVISSGDDSNYGYFYGDTSTPPLPCVSVSSARAAAQNNVAPSESIVRSFVSNNTSGALGYNGDLNLISAANIPNGVRKVLVVNGTVTISRNLQYSNNYANLTQIPSLTIIANNIHIRADAQVVDADLVAFPTNEQDGIIDTCSNFQDGGIEIPGRWPSYLSYQSSNSCRRVDPSLRVSGKVVARRILWKRTYGTLGTADGAFNGECALTARALKDFNTPAWNPNNPVIAREQCSAELISYSPLNYIKQLNTEVNGGPGLGSVPVSSRELPPIY